MKQRFYIRLFLLVLAGWWNTNLAGQAPVQMPASNTEQSCTLRVILRLAGLPRPGATVGQRIFFTVQQDVFQQDTLVVAAGARAKGWIRAIRSTETTLYLAVEPEAVQKVEGEMVGLEGRTISLEYAGATARTPDFTVNLYSGPNFTPLPKMYITGR